ncbi:MAG: adenosylcobinamide-GDP ribazoletransferase [Acidimicrobiales bacterium]
MSREPAGRHLVGLLAAASFLTVLGRPRPLGRSIVAWFPVVGALLGALLGVIWWLGLLVWPPVVAAVVVVGSELALTGALHLDGLADAADGLLATPDPGRAGRLQIMGGPEVGAFAVAAVFLSLAGRVAGLAAIARRVAGPVPLAALAAGPSATGLAAGHAASVPGAGPVGPALVPGLLLLASIGAASRAEMGLIAALLPEARPGGLGAAVSASAREAVPVLVAALGGAVVMAAGWRPVAGPVAVLMGLVAAAGVAAVARARLGGHTGDVLGAAGVAAETVGLIVAAARW